MKFKILDIKSTYLWKLVSSLLKIGFVGPRTTIRQYDVNVHYDIITGRNKGVNLYYKCIFLSIMKNYLMHHVWDWYLVEDEGFMVTLIITMESEVQVYLVYCISFLDDRCTCSLPDTIVSVESPIKSNMIFWYNIFISITLWH